MYLSTASRTNLNQHDSPTATILSQSNSNSISPLHLSPSIIATRQHDPKRDSGGSGSNSHSSNSNSNSNTSTIETTEWRSHTNVYVKGLPERCTTEDLQAWAEQVARPVSVKTIRDAKDHNVCTGLGGSFCLCSPPLSVVSSRTACLPGFLLGSPKLMRSLSSFTFVSSFTVFSSVAQVQASSDSIYPHRPNYSSLSSMQFTAMKRALRRCV
jgi:hypothetical protein